MVETFGSFGKVARTISLELTDIALNDNTIELADGITLPM
jgi:hypothetical protein